MASLKITTALPAEDLYATYKPTPESDYRSVPVLCLMVVKLSGDNHDIMPMYWDLVGADWKDARTLPGFLGITKSKMLEAHYQATEADLKAALSANTEVAPKDQKGLLETAAVRILTEMLAMKQVRHVLANRLPTPVLMGEEPATGKGKK